MTVLIPGAVDAQVGPGGVTGSFFVDTNRDGVHDASEDLDSSDALFPPGTISVRAFDAAGSSADGVVSPGTPPTYSIDTSGLVGTSYRVEFGLSQEALDLGWSPTIRGVDSKSTVQFVAAGDVADLGVVPPSRCQDGDGSIFLTCFTIQDLVDTVVSMDYDTANKIPNALEADTGSVWGIAYDEWTNTIWTSAVLRRGFELGPNGLDAVYAQTDNGAWQGFNLGASFIPADFDPAAVTVLDQTGVVAAQVNRIGIGDIDLSADGRSLFVANVTNNSLHIYDVSTGIPAQQSQIVIPDPGCGGDPYYIWAVKSLSATNALVGATCTGEVSGVVQATIYNVSSAGANAVPGLTSLPLDYERGCSTGASAPAVCNTTASPWTDSAAVLHAAGELPPWGGTNPWNQYRQLLLTDIEVAADGDLVLGLFDRTANQHLGGRLWDDQDTPEVESQLRLFMGSGGDIVHVDNVGTLDAPVYVPEPGMIQNTGTEVFDFDRIGPHHETSSGSMWVHPGYNDAVVAVIDPLQLSSIGIEIADASDGTSIAGYEMGGGNAQFKAGGLGDVEGCFVPIEIGDRVWLDSDGDGVQDPGEIPLEDVTVTVTGPGIPVPLVVQTDADGIWTVDSTDGLTHDAAYVITVDVLTNVTELPGNAENTDLIETPSFSVVAGASTENDSNLVDGEITANTGAAGRNDHSFDAGFTLPDNRIGNLTWFDIDADAEVDVDEPAIAGLTVQLFAETGTVEGFDATDELVGTTTTDATGNYWFDELMTASTYYVAIPEQSGAVTVGADVLSATSLMSSPGGTLDNNDLDNGDDGEPVSGFLSVSGPIDLVDDAEITAEADANTGTDAETYVEAAGSVDHQDDRSNLTVDLGFVQKNRIGNLVWVDGVDGVEGFNDGIAAPAETDLGIAAVAVQLFRDSAEGGTPGVYDAEVDALVATTSTDADGIYWFTAIPDGTYFIGIPAGQTGQSVDGADINLSNYVSSVAPRSLADLGLDDLDDGDASVGFASFSDPFTVAYDANPTDEAGDFDDLAAGAAEAAVNAKVSYYYDANSDLTIDFGFVQPPLYSVGNLVWYDIDDDGLAETGEPGIVGVTVELYDTEGVFVASAVTDAVGHYLFEELMAGEYVVQIPVAQTGQTLDDGSATAVDLQDLIVSAVVVVDPDDPTDLDNDSNGVSGDAAVTAGAVSLGEPDQFAPNEPGLETLRIDDPTIDDDGGTTSDEQRNLMVDFGFAEPLRVGNLVWLDDGNAGEEYVASNEDDGQADAGETGIAGVLVQLLDEAEAVVAETVTDGAGNYWFDGLRPGTYSVAIPTNQAPALGELPGIVAEALVGVRSSTGQSPDPEGLDNDDDGVAVGEYDAQSAPFQLTRGDEAADETGDFDDATAGAAEEAANLATSGHLDNHSNLEVDFGFSPTPTYRLGNLVWVEVDDDGIAEDGEAGVADILVQLIDSADVVVSETLTNADGKYLFTDLEAGDYTVRLPFDQAAVLGGASGDPAVFDDYTTTGTPEPDANNDTDNDNNGVENAEGFTSGPVTLGEGSGNDEPTGESNRQDDPTLDEDGSLPDNRSDLTVDFGLRPVYRLGNLVWEDYDNSGSAEAGEPGIQGVLVQLLDDTNTVIAETVTDDAGKYEFTDLDAGDYAVRLPATQAPLLGDQATLIPGVLDGLVTSGTPQADPADDADSDNNGISSDDGFTSGSVTLGGGTGDEEPIGETNRTDDVALDEDGSLLDTRSNLTVDFGLFRGIRAGNQVFLDGMQGDPGYDNGIFDAGESGIAGVDVELWLDDGDAIFDPTLDSQVGTDLTDADGNYTFDNLIPGADYFIAVEDIGLGSTPSPAPTGLPTDDDNDNDGTADVATGYDSVTDVFTVETSSSTTSELDTNPLGDDPAEDEANAAGDFYPDANSELTVDLGFIDVPLYRIGNLVWLEDDLDGIAEDGELGIANVEVQLLDEDGVVLATMTTNAEGKYDFAQLLPGDYQVSIPMDQLVLDGLSSTTRGEEDNPNDDVDNNDNGLVADDAWTSGVISVGEGGVPGNWGTEPTNEVLRNDAATDDDDDAGFYNDDRSNYTVDFSFAEVPVYELGNLVWLEINDDGIADSGEPGIGGVAVQLFLDGALLDETITAADGTYVFAGLLADDYEVVVPAGQSGQILDDGSSTVVDLSTLLPSQVVAADPDDPADVDNDSNGVLASDGALRSGLISIGDPDPFDPNEPIDETDRSGGDDIEPGNDLADTLTNYTVDFGFAEPLRVGNLVWLDDGGTATGVYEPLNEDNGIADAGEAGIAGVLVQLVDDQGVVAAETVTDGNGNYWFDSLRAGSYQVGIPADQSPTLGEQPDVIDTALDDLVTTTVRSGAAEDGDDDNDGVAGLGFVSISQIFDLEQRSEADDEQGDFADLTTGAAEAAADAAAFAHTDTNSNLEIDLGLIVVPTYRLGNLVWEDFDNDGIADGGEPGIQGVLVQLLDDTGSIVAETVTDVDGLYVFEDLPAGTYSVVLPADQAVTLDTQPDVIAGVLDGLATSGSPEPEPDDGTDNDNNGTTANGAVENQDLVSGPVTLGESNGKQEPEGETSRTDDVTLDEDGALRDDRSNLTVDFGLFRSLRLGNQVFADGIQGDPGYNNGLIDPGEPGIGGVVVELWEDDGDGVFDPATDQLVESTATDPEGNYLFTNVAPQTPFFVAIAEIGAGLASETISSDPFAADNDNDGAASAGYVSVSSVVTLEIGTATTDEGDASPAADGSAEAEADDASDIYPDTNSELAVDFGFIDVPLYRLGNLVWNDLDNDGLAEAGEDGIADVTVQLLDSNGVVVMETVTDAEGKYTFGSLAPGDYRVSIPADQAALATFQSSNRGEEADANADGDNNDNGVSGESAGEQGSWTSSVVTLGADPVVAPSDTEPADETLRSDDSTDDDLGDGLHNDGRSNTTVDFGFYQLALGSQVWFDTDGDGFLGADEAGIDDVPVVLYEVQEDGSLLLIAETVTAPIDGEAGSYHFDALVHGAEYVVEIPVEAFVPGAPLELLHSTPNDAQDPDVDPTDGDDNGLDVPLGEAIQSLPVVLEVGDEPTGELQTACGCPDANENMTVDFGVVKVVLGGFLWDDVNRDGSVDRTEDRLASVHVALLKADPVAGEVLSEEPVATTVTDENGSYNFAGLDEGDYIVQVAASVFGPQGALPGMTSSIGNGITPPDANNGVEGDDNGVLRSTGEVRTLPINVTFGSDNLTVDLGFNSAPPMSVGNRVWLDGDRSGTHDEGEVGIANVVVELLNSDTDQVMDEVVADADGYYLFEDLLPGTYVVRIPASNFQESGALRGFANSDNDAADPDDDPTDRDDQGYVLSAQDGVRSAALSIVPTFEPTEGVETDLGDLGHGSAADMDSNLTVDFGFYEIPITTAAPRGAAFGNPIDGPVPGPATQTPAAQVESEDVPNLLALTGGNRQIQLTLVAAFLLLAGVGFGGLGRRRRRKFDQ